MSVPEESEKNPWEQETFRYDRLHLRIQKVVRAAVELKPRTVLELGCGIGILRDELKRQLPDLDYYGCDISEAAVQQLANPQIVQIDLNKDPIPFGDKQFKCILGSGVFEYVTPLEDFLSRLRNRLEPGGSLVASFYNMNHLSRRFRTLCGLTVSHHAEWKNEFPPREFEKALINSGFEILKVVPVDIRIGRPKIRTRQWSIASKMNEWAPFKYLLGSQLVFVCRRLDVND